MLNQGLNCISRIKSHKTIQLSTRTYFFCTQKWMKKNLFGWNTDRLVFNKIFDSFSKSHVCIQQIFTCHSNANFDKFSNLRSHMFLKFSQSSSHDLDYFSNYTLILFGPFPTSMMNLSHMTAPIFTDDHNAALGHLPPQKQWAAVRTNWLLIRVPPHCCPFTQIITIQGIGSRAGFPPTIRFSASFFALAFFFFFTSCA